MKKLISILFFILPSVSWAQYEQVPEFPGGQDSLSKFIKYHLKYPEQAKKDGISGNVVVGFTVNEDGSVADAKIVKQIHPLLDNEALRIVNLLPKFTPGYQDGKPVKVMYNVPIKFRLE